MSDIVPSELRTCRTCHIPQPTSEYYARAKYKCKSCFCKDQRERGQRNRSKSLSCSGKLLDVVETLQCNICGEVKPISEFKKNRHHASGYQRQCKYCYNIAQRDWYNPSHDRRRTLAKYNLTVEQYEEMVKLQDGKCAICGQTPMGTKRLVVDHDHQTGEVRGLLCSHCNVALGLLNEDPARIKNLLAYIYYHSGKVF